MKCDLLRASGRIAGMKKSYSYRKKKKSSHAVVLVVGLVFLLAAFTVAMIDLGRFRGVPGAYPAGSTIGNIPVGGLDRTAAEARLAEAYAVPVELVFEGARMQFSPGEIGFNLDIPGTFVQAEAKLANASWWKSLWGRPEIAEAFSSPILASVNQETLAGYLAEQLALRYERLATATVPILYSTNVQPGEPGLALTSLPQAVQQVNAALLSPTERVVRLAVGQTPALPMDPYNLEVMLKQTIQLEGFGGLAELYLEYLPDGEKLHFATLAGSPLPVDVAYSAASTIKIPIMVSTLRRLEEPLPQQASAWLSAMISESLNPPADGLMMAYLDNTRGPLILTADMRELGYQNTFMAGYFEPGSPLLERITTPANSRKDVYLDPDFYNQTVPSEIGDLLSRIFACAKQPGGDARLFAGEVTPTECQLMLDLLADNRIGSLIEAGLPPEGIAAHKHGWTAEMDGLLHTISDSGVVFTPGGDYTLVIFIHTDEQLLFDTGNTLFAKLSQCIYNATNPTEQAAWYSN